MEEAGLVEVVGLQKLGLDARAESQRSDRLDRGVLLVDDGGRLDRVLQLDLLLEQLLRQRVGLLQLLA